MARIRHEQPTWAVAQLAQELLDLPALLDRFVEIQHETNQLTDRRLNAIEERLNGIEGRIGNMEGGQYERTVRTKALTRTPIVLGFTGARVALNQEGLVNSNRNSAVAEAVREGRIPEDGYAVLFEADLVISGQENRHTVVEVRQNLRAADILDPMVHVATDWIGHWLMCQDSIAE